VILVDFLIDILIDILIALPLWLAAAVLVLFEQQMGARASPAK
jgi:hypothetical protein